MYLNVMMSVCPAVAKTWHFDDDDADADVVITCVRVCPLQTVDVIVKLGTVTASDMRMRHVLIISTSPSFKDTQILIMKIINV